jgi:hypothetical protein
VRAVHAVGSCFARCDQHVIMSDAIYKGIAVAPKKPRKRIICSTMKISSKSG